MLRISPQNIIVLISKFYKDIKSYLLRYTTVGLINSVLTLFIYVFAIKILKIEYLLSLFISWVFGVLFTYTINFVWTFRTEKKLVYRIRLLKYFLVCITSLFINLSLLKYFNENIIPDPLLSQIVLIPPIAAINFIGSRYWALKPNIE